jgi:hypothetical protein
MARSASPRNSSPIASRGVAPAFFALAEKPRDDRWFDG